MMNKIYVLVLLSLGLSSCFKEIDTVKLERDYGEVFEAQNSIYNSVTFYKIYENITLEVSSEELGTWDLIFQSASKGDNVLHNYTISARSIATGQSDFSSVDKNTVNELYSATWQNWHFNDPAYSDIRDSIALKNWENGEVYLLYRGNAFPPEKAYYKIQFIDKTSDSYTFKYAHVESLDENIYTLNRTDGLAYRTFSFDQNSVVDFEPRIAEWDFCFLPYFGWYETLTPGVYSPYNVTGVIVNTDSGIEIARIDDETIEYNDIDLPMLGDFEFTSWRGAIGSTWKKIPSTENPVYYMDEAKKYILKMPDGNFYKMRFLDFYNNEGEKGYPKFEIQIMK